MDIVNVLTGEVKVEIKQNMMVSNAIGSCIVISAYNPITKVGGMAHIMLPGRAPSNTKNYKLRYAENAIETLINKLKGHGSSLPDFVFSLVGGGNVLKNVEDKICKYNIESVNTIIQKYQLNIVGSSLGGYIRRTSKLDIKNGIFYYTEGDSEEKVLFNTISLKG
jgi:chemotaxis protein CheD